MNCPYCDADPADLVGPCPACGRDPRVPRKLCPQCRRWTPVPEPLCCRCGAKFKNELGWKIPLIFGLFLIGIAVAIAIRMLTQ